MKGYSVIYDMNAHSLHECGCFLCIYGNSLFIFRFSTRQKGGLLFYNGRYNERHDFIALEIIDGRLQFSFSLGVGTTHVVASSLGGVNDGRWHTVTVSYFNRVSTTIT